MAGSDSSCISFAGCLTKLDKRALLLQTLPTCRRGAWGSSPHSCHSFFLPLGDLHERVFERVDTDNFLIAFTILGVVFGILIAILLGVHMSNQVTLARVVEHEKTLRVALEKGLLPSEVSFQRPGEIAVTKYETK